MSFVQEIRAAIKRYQDEGLDDVAARERLLSEHSGEIGTDLMEHAAIVLQPILLVPEADVRIRCPLHDGVHTADDPDFGWSCVAAMARALSRGINMTPAGELE